MSDFKGYSTFDEVKSPTLRAWNRLSTIYNMKEQGGNSLALRYAKKFDQASRLQIFILGLEVKEKGFENVRREIFRSAA